MTYIAAYLNQDDSSGRTLTIHADSDRAAHELALINMPDGFALAEIHRVPVPTKEMPFGELLELTIQLRARACSGGVSEAVFDRATEANQEVLRRYDEAQKRLRQWGIDADEARGIDEENHHLRLRLKATEERAEKAEAKLRRVIGGQSR